MSKILCLTAVFLLATIANAQVPFVKSLGRYNGPLLTGSPCFGHPNVSHYYPKSQISQFRIQIPDSESKLESRKPKALDLKNFKGSLMFLTYEKVFPLPPLFLPQFQKLSYATENRVNFF